MLEKNTNKGMKHGITKSNWQNNGKKYFIFYSSPVYEIHIARESCVYQTDKTIAVLFN